MSGSGRTCGDLIALYADKETNERGVRADMVDMYTHPALKITSLLATTTCAVPPCVNSTPVATTSSPAGFVMMWFTYAETSTVRFGRPTASRR